LLADSPASRAASYQYRPSLGNRLSAIALALAICALIVLMLIRMGLLPPMPAKIAEKITAVDLKPQGVENKERPQASKSAQRREKPAAARTTVTPQVQPNPAPVAPVPWISLSREQFAASDISKLGRHPAAAGESGAASGKAYGPGEGPGGMQLVGVDWYREPTRAEMVTYMPHRDVAGGWAEIACKMEEHYHVEDCRELGESPRGSGLSRALRLASWQFLVRPPKVNGHEVLGGWVRIHFDFTAPPAREANDDVPGLGGPDAN
jgi:protein TonB